MPLSFLPDAPCAPCSGALHAQALELLAYEANMALATISGNEAHDAVVRTSAEMHAHASAPPMAINIERGARMQARTGAAGERGPTTFTPRLFCVLLSALSKIAARSPDLIPRVLLCFGKLVKVSVGAQADGQSTRF